MSVLRNTLVAGATVLTIAAGTASVPSAALAFGGHGGGGFGGGHGGFGGGGFHGGGGGHGGWGHGGWGRGWRGYGWAGYVGVDRMAIAGGAAVTIRMAVMDIRIDYASPIAN
jgi:hypothetical protein